MQHTYVAWKYTLGNARVHTWHVFCKKDAHVWHTCVAESAKVRDTWDRPKVCCPAKFSFILTQFVDGVKLNDKLPLSAERWEADIELDAMLSCFGMVENQIVIFPNLKALAK